jgi:hypothetical protein
MQKPSFLSSAVSSVSLVTLLMTAGGCTWVKSKGSSSKSVDDEKAQTPVEAVQNEITPPAACADGLTQMSFGLDSGFLDTTAAQAKFPKAKIIKSSPENNLRIDLCTDFDQQTILTGMALNLKESNLSKMISKSDIVVQKGLSDFIFSNTSNLNIVSKLPNQKFLHIMGGADFGEINIVISPSESDSQNLQQSMALVGSATGGLDPFSICAGASGGNNVVVRNIKLDTASINITTCEGNVGTSGGHPHTYIGFEVTDSNPKLKENANKTIKISKEEITEGKLAIVTDPLPHHNDCESFGITLPHAKYFVTNVGSTGPAQNGCASLPGAPKLDVGATSALFTIQYGSDAVSKPKSLPVANFWNVR